MKRTPPGNSSEAGRGAGRQSRPPNHRSWGRLLYRPDLPGFNPVASSAPRALKMVPPSYRRSAQPCESVPTRGNEAKITKNNNQNTAVSSESCRCADLTWEKQDGGGVRKVTDKQETPSRVQTRHSSFILCFWCQRCWDCLLFNHHFNAESVKQSNFVCNIFWGKRPYSQKNREFKQIFQWQRRFLSYCVVQR